MHFYYLDAWSYVGINAENIVCEIPYRVIDYEHNVCSQIYLLKICKMPSYDILVGKSHSTVMNVNAMLPSFYYLLSIFYKRGCVLYTSCIRKCNEI